MTSLVSSYVQPDNLAYALVSAALFYATKLRDGSLTPPRIVPLGVALGLLAVTKYQFFLSATLPIAALLAVTLTCSKCSAARGLVTFAVLLAPAIALLSVQHWIVDAGTSVAHTAPRDISLAYVRGVAVHGPAALMGYLASSVSGAFLGCFITGICAAGYWGVLGWGDTPIVIGTPLLEELLRGAIALITLIVAAIVLFYCARNAIGLVAAAARNHARAAARIAVADPVINSYLLFAAIIVALYVATNNVFGVSGRHWYPYIFPAFLCLVWYAPRSLFGPQTARRHRRCLHAPRVLRRRGGLRVGRRAAPLLRHADCGIRYCRRAPKRSRHGTRSAVAASRRHVHFRAHLRESSATIVARQSRSPAPLWARTAPARRMSLRCSTDDSPWPC